MAQHDYDLANAAGAAFRADLNNVLAAIVSLNAGSAAPSVTFAHMPWMDTTNAKLKKRNAANTAWIEILSFDETGNTSALLGSFDLSALTAETALALADTFPFYDASAPGNRKVTLPNLFKAIGVLSALTAPAIDDVLAIYDLSGTAAAGITLANMLKVINGLTEDTTPDGAADFVLSYDTSAGAVKKVKPNNLGGASGGITTIASGSLSGSSIEITSIPATYAYLVLKVAGASADGANRYIHAQVSTNNGSSYDATAGNYSDPSGDGVGSVFGAGFMGAASATSNWEAMILGYQNGPTARYAEGTNMNQYTGSTAAIDAIKIAVSAGNFDAGTYALYGIR